MPKLILTQEEATLPIANANVELLGQAVRQFMEANPLIDSSAAMAIVASGLIFAQYAADSNADTIDSDVTMTSGDKWHIELMRVGTKQ